MQRHSQRTTAQDMAPDGRHMQLQSQAVVSCFQDPAPSRSINSSARAGERRAERQMAEQLIRTTCAGSRRRSILQCSSCKLWQSSEKVAVPAWQNKLNGLNVPRGVAKEAPERLQLLEDIEVHTTYYTTLCHIVSIKTLRLARHSHLEIAVESQWNRIKVNSF